MPCVDSFTDHIHRPGRSGLRCLPLLGALLLGGCAPAPLAPPAASSPGVSPGTPPGTRSDGTPGLYLRPTPAPPGRPLRRVDSWDAYRLQVAERLVEANPSGTYGGPVQEPLLAIPVLEIELNADGSVRRIVVKRQPGQAQDTVQLAIAAVHRAAPFGPVAHLPRPWTFVEVFLFNDQRRFKPRTLDL